jgi:hypothetical protein
MAERFPPSSIACFQLVFFLCNNFHVGAGTAVSKNKKKKTSTEEENEKVEEVMDEVAEIVGEEES